MPSLWESIFGSRNTTEVLSGLREPSWAATTKVRSELKIQPSIVFTEQDEPMLLEALNEDVEIRRNLTALDAYIAELIGWRDKLAKLTDKE